MLALLDKRHVKYHLSKPADRFRIQCKGLRCDLDARGKGRIWLCDRSEIASVARHLAKRDGTEYVQYALWTVDIHHWEEYVKPCGRTGIYFCSINLGPAHLTLEGCIQVYSDDGLLDSTFAC